MEPGEGFSPRYNSHTSPVCWELELGKWFVELTAAYQSVLMPRRQLMMSAGCQGAGWGWYQMPGKAACRVPVGTRCRVTVGTRCRMTGTTGCRVPRWYQVQGRGAVPAYFWNVCYFNIVKYMYTNSTEKRDQKREKSNNINSKVTIQIPSPITWRTFASSLYTCLTLFHSILHIGKTLLQFWTSINSLNPPTPSLSA